MQVPERGGRDGHRPASSRQHPRSRTAAALRQRTAPPAGLPRGRVLPEKQRDHRARRGAGSGHQSRHVELAIAVVRAQAESRAHQHDAMQIRMERTVDVGRRDAAQQGEHTRAGVPLVRLGRAGSRHGLVVSAAHEPAFAIPDRHERRTGCMVLPLPEHRAMQASRASRSVAEHAGLLRNPIAREGLDRPEYNIEPGTVVLRAR